MHNFLYYAMLTVALGLVVSVVITVMFVLCLCWKEIKDYWRTVRSAVSRKEVKGMERKGNLYIVRAKQVAIEDDLFLN